MIPEDEISIFLANDRIKNILIQVLDKADSKPLSQRTNRLSFPVDSKYFPELFYPQNPGDDEMLEEAISELCRYGLFELKCAAKKKYLPLIRKNAKLYFNAEFEDEIRIFYSRPVKNDKWKSALEAYPFKSTKAKDILSRPITIPGKSHEDIIRRFDDWSMQENHIGTARQESARCFWGMSKVFDNRDDIIQAFSLKEAPVMLNVYAFSEEISKVLFIENLDTFVAAIESGNPIFSNTVIIYSSGYKASAKKIRDRRGSRMFFEMDCCFSDKGKHKFLSWFYRESREDVESFFWGDLDYSGIGILIALRERFPDIAAWEPGYRQMVTMQQDDGGHTPEMAKKEKQVQPCKKTGIKYVDDILLQTLNQYKTFMDQEIVYIEKIQA